MQYFQVLKPFVFLKRIKFKKKSMDDKFFS